MINLLNTARASIEAEKDRIDYEIETHVWQVIEKRIDLHRRLVLLDMIIRLIEEI